MTITITNTGGRWFINGKTYSELSFEEQDFFNNFLIATKLDTLVKK